MFKVRINNLKKIIIKMKQIMIISQINNNKKNLSIMKDKKNIL
jgi:hypothetical protein